LASFGDGDRRTIMDTPAVPPYGDLFERARKSRRITIQQAAAAAGIVKQTWIDIVKGRTARPKADTLADMARAVGVSPERLEAEGHQGEAADILREMLRESPTSAPLRPVPSLPAAPPTPEDVRDMLLAAYPDDIVLRALVAQDDGLPGAKPVRMIVAEMWEWIGVHYPQAQSGSGAAGLPPAPERPLNDSLTSA
jgi:transcriptional regulator with XRE-family HTH domain